MFDSKATATVRKSVTRPTRWLLENVDFSDKYVLHHGCGDAYMDTEAFFKAGALCRAYDPNFYAWAMPPKNNYYDVVVSNYVLNVLTPPERKHALDDIRMYLKPGGFAYITVRTDKVAGKPYEDGVVTKRNTFQTQMRAGDWDIWFPDGYKRIHTASGMAIYKVMK